MNCRVSWRVAGGKCDGRSPKGFNIHSHRCNRWDADYLKCHNPGGVEPTLMAIFPLQDPAAAGVKAV